MKKTVKNRKGFTLVEMLLSLAIICMIGGVIGGICVQISNSFVTTYNIDDSADYAMLYAKGFENSFLASTQGAGSSGNKWTWYMNNPMGNGGHPSLMVKDPTNTREVFTPQHIGNSTTPSKWSVFMFFAKEEHGPATSKSVLIKYRIFIKDNYSRTDYIYRYDGSFWVPRFQERAEQAGATNRKIEVLTTAQDNTSYPMTKKTFTDHYGFTEGSGALSAIEGSLEAEGSATYYTKIQYLWG